MQSSGAVVVANDSIAVVAADSIGTLLLAVCVAADSISALLLGVLGVVPGTKLVGAVLDGTSELAAVVEVVVVVASSGTVTVGASWIAAVVVVGPFVAWVTDFVVPSGLATILLGGVSAAVKFVVVGLTTTVVA